MLNQRGSAVVETIFAMLVILFLALGAIQVALTLYARNVLLAATHEGARAAAEYNAQDGDAAEIARSTIERSAGGLIEGLQVTVSAVPRGTDVVVRVASRAGIRDVGPIPFPMSVTASSTATREAEVP